MESPGLSCSVTNPSARRTVGQHQRPESCSEMWEHHNFYAVPPRQSHKSRMEKAHRSLPTRRDVPRLGNSTSIPLCCINNDNADDDAADDDNRRPVRGAMMSQCGYYHTYLRYMISIGATHVYIPPSPTHVCRRRANHQWLSGKGQELEKLVAGGIVPVRFTSTLLRNRCHWGFVQPQGASQAAVQKVSSGFRPSHLVLIRCCD